MNLDNEKTNTFLIAVLIIVLALIIIFAYLIIQEVKTKKIETEPTRSAPSQVNDLNKNNGQTIKYAPKDSISATPQKPLEEIKIKKEIKEVNTPEVIGSVSGIKKDGLENRAEETKNFESNYIKNPDVTGSVSAIKK